MKKKSPFKGKFINKKRLLLVLVIIVLVAVMVFSNPDVKEFLFGNETVKISFQSGINYEAFAYGKEMLLVSNEGIRAVNESGEDEWNVVYAITSPVTVIKDDYIMVADMHGTTVNVYENDKNVFKVKTKNEILTAKMNTDGYVAVATDEQGYKGSVAVFDDEGNEYFKWYSGTGYIGDIDISSDGILAVSQLMTDKENIYSRIVLVDSESNEEAYCIAEHDGMIMKLRFNGDDELVAVSENGVYCYESDGELSYNIDFGGRIPVSCNIENEDNMVFAFDSGINNTILESYSDDGELRGKYEADGKIRAFDVKGEYILFATVGKVKYISPEGELEEEMVLSNDAKKIRIFSDRDRFMVLGGSSAEIIKIN